MRHFTAALAALAIALPGAALAQPAKQDQRYFHDMAQANLAEVETSKLAEARAQDGAVKSFARHMVEDHGQMLDEQRALAKKKDFAMPAQPAKEHQAALRKLEGAKGQEFDRLYMEQMVKDHEKSLALAREAAKKAKDPALRSMAAAAAPKIDEHLKMARQISGAAAGATAPREKADK